MARPTFTQGTPGSVIATGTVIPDDEHRGAWIDGREKFEIQVDCQVKLPGTINSATGVRFDFHKIYRETALNGAESAGSTSIDVDSATGIKVGSQIAIYDATNGGEIVTVSNVSSLTLTVSALKTNHTDNALIFLIETMPTVSVTPGPTSGSYTASAVYSKAVYLSTSYWWVNAVNLDVDYDMTIEVTAATIDEVS